MVCETCGHHRMLGNVCRRCFPIAHAHTGHWHGPWRTRRRAPQVEGYPMDASTETSLLRLHRRAFEDHPAAP